MWNKNNRCILVLLNGRAGVGKDTFVKYCKEYAETEEISCEVYNTSRSDPGKLFLISMGWDGIKDAESRKLLKHIVDFLEYKGLLCRRLETIIDFVKKNSNSKNSIIFYHVRDPVIINKLMNKYNKTEVIPISLLLIRNTEGKEEPENWWDVENYHYTMKIHTENKADSKNAAWEFMSTYMNILK